MWWGQLFSLRVLQKQSAVGPFELRATLNDYNRSLDRYIHQLQLEPDYRHALGIKNLFSRAGDAAHLEQSLLSIEQSLGSDP